MKRYSFAVLPFLFCAFLALTACQSSSSSGYSRSGWDYSAPAPKAEARPDTLASDAIERSPLDDSLRQERVMQPAIPEQQSRPDLPAVKVAILLPLSGESERLGTAMLNAAQIALFDIGHNNFQLSPYDTQGSPQGASNAARQALQDGAQLVLGPVFGRSALAARTVLNGSGVNMIAFTTDWGLANRETFVMGFLPFDQVERVIRYAAASGIQNVGVVSPSDEYGDIVMDAYNQNAYQAGLNTVAAERFSPRARDLTSVMSKISAYESRVGPDGETVAPPPFEALFMPVGGDNARTLSALAMKYDLNPDQVRRIGTGLWDDSSLATEVSMDGAWFAAPDPAARDDFMRRYFEIYNVSPPRLATLAYDATALAAVLAQNGLRQGRQPDFNYNALTNPNGFSGIDGIFRFRPNGLVERGLGILEYRGGKITVRDPAPRTFQQRGF